MRGEGRGEERRGEGGEEEREERLLYWPQGDLVTIMTILKPADPHENEMGRYAWEHDPPWES